MQDNLNIVLKAMTTTKKEDIQQKNPLEFIHQKMEEGCRLFSEDMPAEAKIAFDEARRFSEELVEEHPNDHACQVTLAETYHILALGYSRIEEYEQAKSLLQKAFSVYDNIKDLNYNYEPVLGSTLARIEKSAGNDEKAIKILEMTLDAIDKNAFPEITQDSFIYGSDLVLLASTYYDSDQYEKAVELTRRVVTLKKTRPDCALNNAPQDLIDLLNKASFHCTEHNDQLFYRFVVEEGLESCNQAVAEGKKINLLCYGTFFQDLLKIYFFGDEADKLKATYQGLMVFCDKHIDEEPKLKKYKISGQLNYAVFCNKNGLLGQADEIVRDAISACTELEDDDGPELTLFMVSALNILTNIQWEQGERQGALRDLSSECNLLQHYLERHQEMAPSLLPLFIDLVLNQCNMLYELGKQEQGEALIDNIKANFKTVEEDDQNSNIAAYLMTLKKIADFHWSVGVYEKAIGEYQETLYIMKVFKDMFPEIADSIQSIEREIQEIMSSRESSSLSDTQV